MTYTNEINFQTEVVTQPSENDSTTLQKLKVLQQEGSQRSKRVASILRAAFSETAAEFKAGHSAMSPLAKEVTAETVAAVKDNSQKVSDTVSQIWQDAEGSDIKDGDMIERIIRFLKSLAKTAKENLFPQIKHQANRLDGVLSERYGDRYATIKSRFDEMRSEYVTYEAAESTTAESNAVDVPAIEVKSEIVR